MVNRQANRLAARYPHHRRHSRLCGKFVCNIGRTICMRKKHNVCACDFIFQLHIQTCICTLHALCYLDVLYICNCASIVGIACAIFTLRRLRCCYRKLILYTVRSYFPPNRTQGSNKQLLLLVNSSGLINLTTNCS